MNPYDQNSEDKRVAVDAAKRELDENLHTKLMANLQWAMLFFLFNNSADKINEEEKLPKNCIQKRFMKLWLRSVDSTITGPDIEAINEVLSTPKNLFHSALQNDNEKSDSTEAYQEKYNKIISDIETFFLKSTLEDDDNTGKPPPDSGFKGGGDDRGF
jgi:hypothetical protein